MFDFLFFQIYRWLLFPLAEGLLWVGRPWWPEKIQQMIEDRRGPQLPTFSSRPIWIHASSGEIEYAKSVIRELKNRYPSIPILVTYFSPSALKLMKNSVDADQVFPLPWDSRQKNFKFIQAVKPRLVLFARTDVWPDLSYQLRQMKIDSYLFSATLAHNSSRSRGLARLLSRWAFKNLTGIFCVSAEDRREFELLASGLKVEISGDTRFDQALYRLNHPKALPSELKPKKTWTLVAGSTWPEDERVLLPGVAHWLKTQNAMLILAPHETSETRLRDAEQACRDLGLKLQTFSKSKTLAPETQVLLIDQVGILPELYTWGQLAFVGGSFKSRVHSVMEPLMAGLPVLVGPQHENNREALHFQLQTIKLEGQIFPVVQKLSSSDEIRSILSQYSELKIAAQTELKSEIKSKVQKSTGATQALVDQIAPGLESLDPSIR